MSLVIGFDPSRGDDKTAFCLAQFNGSIMNVVDCGFIQTREVSAKRCRKLRRRGEHCWYSRLTSNGKCRYFWSMRR